MRTLVSISDNHCKGFSNESMTMPHMRSLDQLKPLPAGWLGQQRVGKWFLTWAAQKSCPSHFGHSVHGGGSAGLTGGLAAGPSQQEHVWPSRCRMGRVLQRRSGKELSFALGNPSGARWDLAVPAILSLLRQSASAQPSDPTLAVCGPLFVWHSQSSTRLFAANGWLAQLGHNLVVAPVTHEAPTNAFVVGVDAGSMGERGLGHGGCLKKGSPSGAIHPSRSVERTQVGKHMFFHAGRL